MLGLCPLSQCEWIHCRHRRCAHTKRMETGGMHVVECACVYVTRSECEAPSSHSRIRSYSSLYYRRKSRNHVRKTHAHHTYTLPYMHAHTRTHTRTAAQSMVSFNLSFSLCRSRSVSVSSQSSNIDLTIPSHFKMSSVFYVRSMRTVLKLFKFRFNWRRRDKKQKKKIVCVLNILWTQFFFIYFLSLLFISKVFPK